jgi:hypothetical protein
MIPCGSIPLQRRNVDLVVIKLGKQRCRAAGHVDQ